MTTKHYLFKITYNPNHVDLDKMRTSCVIETVDGVMDAITMGLTYLSNYPDEVAASKLATHLWKLEIDHLYDDAIQAYQESIRNEDTTYGWKWDVRTNSGVWTFEWCPFDAEDPVTKESLLAWARRETGEGTDDKVQKFLAGLMGRWYWRSIDELSGNELKDILYEIAMEGDSSVPYSKQTIDQLIDTIMEEVVVACEESYDELEEGRPFGIETMVADDPALWSMSLTHR